MVEKLKPMRIWIPKPGFELSFNTFSILSLSFAMAMKTLTVS